MTFGGNDVFRAGAGDDVICAGDSGSTPFVDGDFVEGGKGRDRIYGEGRSDVLVGDGQSFTGDVSGFGEVDVRRANEHLVVAVTA